MRRYSRRSALILATNATLLAGFWQRTAHANTYTWTSTTDQSWSNQANWSGNVVPGSGDAGLFSSSFVPASQIVNVTSDISLGALLDNLAVSKALTINGPGAGSATLTLFGQTATVPQAGSSFTGANVVLSATGNVSNAAKNLTLGSSLNLSLANAQNIILGTQGAASGGSGQGNVIQINGNVVGGPGVHAAITYLGNGNFGNEGGALDLRGSNTFSGGLTIGSSDGLNGGQVRVNASSNLGTGTIVVNDQGQLIFNTNGTYGNPGQLMVVNGTGLLNNTGNSGAWRTGAASIIWNGDMSVGASLVGDQTNGQVVVSSTGTNIFELHGKLTGSGNLQKQGGGTFLLTGANNDATGTTQIGNGVMTVAAGSSMSTGDLVMLQSSSNTGVALDLYNAFQNIGNLSSGFTQTSGIFSQFINIGSNSIGGVLNIKQTVNKSFGYGSGVNGIGLTSTLTGPGAISLDAGSTAALTLTGPNSYAGGTTIGGGTLNLANGNNGSAVGSGDVEIKSGGHLATGNATVLGAAVSDGAMTGNLTVDGLGVVAPGNDNQTGTLNVSGNLIVKDGSLFNFDVNGGISPVADQIIANGTLSLDSGTEKININDMSVGTGQFKLISYGSSTLSNSFTLGTPTVIGARHYNLTTTATGVVLSITDNSSVRYWSVGGASISSSGPVDGGGTWSNGNGANFFSSNPDTNNASYDNTASTNVVIGNGQGGGQINLGSDVRVGGVLVFGPNSSPYTIGVASDAHAITLVNGLAATGNATINAPVKMEQSQTVSPQVGVTVTTNGGVSEATPGLILTQSNLGTFVLNGTSTYTGGTVINQGVLQAATWGLPAIPASNSVTDNGGLVFSQSTDGNYSGRITGTGSVGINNGSASTVVTLTASNSYSGPTFIQNGILAVGSVSNLGTGAGGIRLTGGTLRILNDLTLPTTFGAVNLSVGTTSGIDTNGHTLTLNNILNGGGNLTKSGAGTLVISGIHTTDVLGQLAINAGTVSIAPPSSVSYGFAADPNGNTFLGDLVVANPMELRLQGGLLSGGGTIRVKPSTVQINSRGLMTIGNDIVMNDNAVPITGFSLSLGANVNNSLTITGAIRGQGDVDFTGGAGIVTLAGTSSYTGASTIDSSTGGEIQIAVNNALPTTTAVHITSTGVLDVFGVNQTIASLDASNASAEVINNSSSSGTLTINGSGSTTYNGFLFDGGQGTLALTLAGTNTGNLALGGTNTYSGGTTLSGGTLAISKDSNLGAPAGTLIFDGGNLATNSITTARPITVNATGGTIDIAAGKVMTINSGTLNWNGGTLNTIDTGTISFATTGATVSVTPGSTIAIGSNNSVTVDATQDPFTDTNVPANHVAIVNKGSFIVTAGIATIAQHTGNGILVVNGGATLHLAASGVGNSAGAISIDATSKLDLANDAMVVNYTGATPDASIRAALVSGYASGAWNGLGIESTTAATDSTSAHKTAIGYAEASTLHKSGTFFGQPIGSNAILMRYTYSGDANLDGVVNSLDLNAVATNFGSSSTEWDQGDFTYDGIVNLLDFNALAMNFGSSLPAPAPVALGASLGTLVPEPITAPLLFAGALLISRRRKSV